MPRTALLLLALICFGFSDGAWSQPGVGDALDARRPAMNASSPGTEPLPRPPSGKIRVAFVLAPNATMIDFAGPWEVFQDVHLGAHGETHPNQMPFELYTVAQTRDAVRASGGMRVLPDYSFDDAPQPHIIVVPALRGSPELHEWLKDAAENAQLTMSVCTGAAVLAEAGLLDGRRATTHHHFLDAFETLFPAVDLVRSVRWVDTGQIATAAGLTSGIDLALHVVARYFGDEVAARTAEFMAHASRDWMPVPGADHGGTAPAPSMQVQVSDS